VTKLSSVFIAFFRAPLLTIMREQAGADFAFVEFFLIDDG
jgi:hypothetical protein